jgi:preprotein translocase subunit SecA
LNAKHHEREAEIVAQAGRHAAVTLSTNMAGRGTDIVLGGNPEGMAAAEVGRRDPDDPEYRAAVERFAVQCRDERERVVEAGGLHIVGTERHESRRIDNQLRGRSGRQGDPGSSRFFLSLEDDLLRIFGAERIQGLMTRLGMEEGEPIEHRMITRAVANAQAKVEGHNFDIRKHLLEYDDVMNQQRKVIYHRRRETLAGDHLREEVSAMIEDLASGIADDHGDDGVTSTEWDWDAIDKAILEAFGQRLPIPEEQRAGLTSEGLAELIQTAASEVYGNRETSFGEPVLRHLERVILLQTIDQQWKDHLLSMDRLKEGVGLRGYAQVNPLQAYQKEGFEYFQEMMERIEAEAVRKLLTVQLVREEDVQRLEAERRPQPMKLSHGAVTAAAPRENDDAAKAGRNDPCPCGSGKKYKKCHGR